LDIATNHHLCYNVVLTLTHKYMTKKNETQRKQQDKKQEEKKFTWHAFWRDIRMIVIIVPIALFIKSNTVELFKIPTGSMEPTLFGANELGRGFGDHLLVLRYIYGFSSRIKVPLINWLVPLPEYRLMIPGMRTPQRGEIVVFENPVNAQMDYIKRCIGVGGDTVAISNRHVYVNGEIQTNIPAQAEYVFYTNAGLLSDRFSSLKDTVDSIKKMRPDHPVAQNIRVNGKAYTEILDAVRTGRSSFDPVFDTITTEITVPENHFFMLGDNSAHSSDSRFWGFVPMNLVKGKAWCVYLPLKRIHLVH
jgi:signal peptidase I